MISPTGEITADYDGFVGTTCFEESTKVVKNLEKLGIETKEKHVRAKDAVGKVGIHEKISH